MRHKTFCSCKEPGQNRTPALRFDSFPTLLKRCLTVFRLQAHNGTDRQIDRRMNRETDRQINRQTDGRAISIVWPTRTAGEQNVSRAYIDCVLWQRVNSLEMKTSPWSSKIDQTPTLRASELNQPTAPLVRPGKTHLPVSWPPCEPPTPMDQLDGMARHYVEAGSNREDSSPST